MKILIGPKYYVKHLNKKIFSGSTNEPNFKIVCNCIHELLNVFEDSAQREHTICATFITKIITTVSVDKKTCV